MRIVKKNLSRLSRANRNVQAFARAMYSPAQPILANIVVTRKCNLSCTYCNQYDKVSQSVPTETMLRRIDALARLRTSGITFTGGEPLLHPDLPQLVSAARRHGSIATVNTNGYLLTPAIIDGLNRAGLDYLWISIDNLDPDDASVKSLKVLDQKLRWLTRHAQFSVTVNSVLGAGVRNPEDAYHIAARARELGHDSTVGIVHGAGGQLIQIGESQQQTYEKIRRLRKPGIFSFAHHDSFQTNLIRGLPNEWHCVAGGRFLYICEDGLVHYCSQRRGQPAIPLEQYSEEIILEASARKKPCAPFCTINCVQQVSYLESFRTNPQAAIQALIDRRRALDPRFRPPLGVRLLSRMFVEGKGSRFWSKIAIAAFGLRRKAPLPAQSRS